MVTASLVAVRGLVRTLHAPLGFDPHDAIVAEMEWDEAEGSIPAEKIKAIIEAAQSIPGVTAAASTSKVPFTGGLRGVSVYPPGTTDFSLSNSVLSPYRFTYHRATSTLPVRDSLVAAMSHGVTPQNPYVAIVNETFAHKMWGDIPAIGRRFIILGHLREVVGGAENGKYHEMQEPSEPVVYLPWSQSDQWHTTFVVRSHGAANQKAPELERILSAMEPNTPITVQRWADAIAGALFAPRAITLALGVMGILAVLLAGDRHLRHGGLQREPADEGTGNPRGFGNAREARHERCRGVPNRVARSGSLVGLLLDVFASRLLGQIVYHANPRDPVVVIGTVLMDGVAWHCGVRNSSFASACRRSIQTPAGRVTVLATAPCRSQHLRDAGRRASFLFASV